MKENDKNILIVGGSRGIGLGFTKYFLEDKSVRNVFSTYNSNSGNLEDLASESDKLTPLRLNVCEEDDFEAVCSAVKDVTDSLDLVLYCTGVLHTDSFGPEKHTKDLSAPNLQHYFNVNSIGAVLCGRYFRDFLNNESNSILAAISARVGSIDDNRIGGWYGYRASKAALNMFFKTLSIEYKRSLKNCSVVLLHPGTTDTELSEPFQKNVKPGKLFSVEQTVGYLSSILNEVTPEDSGRFFAWDGSDIPW